MHCLAVNCSMENTKLIKDSWDKALPISAYFEDLLTAIPLEGNPSDQYIPINQQRVKRLISRIKLTAEAESAAIQATDKTKWLILTEHWCGDSAQIVPVQAAIVAASRGRIEARVLFRDENLELMDQFLTNGGRSIPKTILLDDAFTVRGSWGPRPEEAADLVKRIKSDPAIAHTYSLELHKWYAKDRQIAIQKSIVKSLFI